MYRKMLIIYLLCLCVQDLVFSQGIEKSLKIGLVADIQYADKNAVGSRYYRNSLDKLDIAIHQLNQHNLDIAVILGDMVDEGPKDAKLILEKLNKFKAPFYSILGNHDYPAEFEEDVFKYYSMPSSYYALEKENWTILFLNTNELASYSTQKGSALENEFLLLKDKHENLGRNNLKSWNGAIGIDQLAWIRKQLYSAEKNGRNVLVFTHHPLYPEIGYEVLNNRVLLDVFAKSACVKAVISGHNHAGNFMLFGNLPCITLEGMVETNDQNSFGMIELSSTKLVLRGFGRMTSRSIDLR